MALEIRDGWLVDVTQEGNVVNTLCTAVDLVQKKANLLTGDSTVVLTLWQGECERTFEVPRETLVHKALYPFLLKKGVSMGGSEDTQKMVSSYLFGLDEELAFEYYHESLGFKDIDGQLVFLHNTPIGQLYGAKANSVYVNPTEVDSKGTLDDWEKVVTKEVCKHVPLEIALAVGFSAPVAYLLRRDNVYAEVPIVAYIGESSTGKTTAAKLAASIFGSITEGAGMVKDINATKNAFFKILEKQIGFPQILDESTGNRDWNLADAIYDLSKGTAKATCNSNSELKDRSSFSGTVIITGEKSIFGTGNTQLGMLARVCELTLPWTKNADHSRRLCEKLNENHGTAVVPFISYLLREYASDSAFLASKFKTELKEFRRLLPNIEGVEERLLNIFATIVVSAQVANEALGLTLNLEAIREKLVEQHNSNLPVKSQAMLLYEVVVSQINVFHTHFPDIQQLTLFGVPNCKLMGMQEKDGGKVIVWVDCHIFEKFVKEKFPNYSTLFKHLYKDGLMKRDSHRHYKFSKTLNVGKVSCYGIILNSYLQRNYEVVGNRPEKPKSEKSLLEDDDVLEVKQDVKVTSPQLAYLLADEEDEIELAAEGGVGNGDL